MEFFIIFSLRGVLYRLKVMMNKSILITTLVFFALAFSVNAALTSVTLNLPLSNSVQSGNISLSATAVDATSVSFYYGNTLIGTNSTGSSSFSLTWDSTIVSNGLYSLIAQATNGTTTLTSSAVSVTINNPGPSGSAPTLCTNVGDLRINDFNFNDELLPGEDIIAEVEVENVGSDDIEDVELELILYDNNNNENASVDTISFDLDEDEELTKEITLSVPNRFDENDDLTLYVFAFEDDNMATNCDSVSDDVKVERDDDDARIEDLTISPSLISCGENFEAFVKVENFGSDDQDDLKLTISNSELKLLEAVYFDLDAFDGLDEDVTKLFTFLVPKDARDGTYTVSVGLEYEDGKSADSSSETITLKNCVKDIYEADFSINVLSSDVTEGKAFSIPVVVKNSEDSDITYEVSISGDWIEFSSGDRLKLRAGQESTLYVSGMVKAGMEGSTSGVVSVKADGTQIKTQPISVTISSDKEEIGLISPLVALSLGLGLVTLIVIIVVVFVLYATGPSNKKVPKHEAIKQAKRK